MISRAQQILVKRAQREAGLEDFEYRAALAQVSGCRSTTDPKLDDRGVDLILAFLEAILWRRVDAGELPPPGGGAVLNKRNFWKDRNPKNNTSRDRFTRASVTEPIAELERALGELGFSQAYCDAVKTKVTGGAMDTFAMHLYKAALTRTLHAKQNSAAVTRSG